jgi:hypothetical protein
MERNINKQRFTELVEISRSYNDLSKRCGWKYNNGKIKYKLEQRILKLGLNSNHFLGKSWSKGLSIPENDHKNDLSTFLVENKYCKSSHLKKRLIKELGWVDKCVWCGIGPEYNDKPLTLQLDHISGNNCDNRLENLRILCPNCHSQTDTWCAKKRPLKRDINFDDVITIPNWFFREPTPIPKSTQKLCDICKINTTAHKSKSFDGYRCKECYLLQNRKIRDRPTKQELVKLLETTSYVKVGKMFGVSDNAVRKWLK